MVMTWNAEADAKVRIPLLVPYLTSQISSHPLTYLILTSDALTNDVYQSLALSRRPQPAQRLKDKARLRISRRFHGTRFVPRS
jgi:hypothetical protein